ncbi:hypothetical protein ACFPTY_18675 [Halomonas beimenensis]|uniref:Uncharacterized protein n=1 Tax=Halomonas beimenensis TaxID=475662 RepID=A0A291P2Y1_9GAMM|nr:hypothetical protein [Halomonas beimenensis]ATJ81244.1 hypothetical protein BEI_0257 [Halomonas beimenensis]
MTPPPAYLRARPDELPHLDLRTFDVIGAIPSNDADSREGIYVVIKERSPYRSRLMIEVEDPDDPETLARLKRLVDPDVPAA